MIAEFLFGSSLAKVMCRLFAATEPMSVSSLASSTGLSRSTVYAELRQLASLGLAIKVEGAVPRYGPNAGDEVSARVISLLDAIEKVERPCAHSGWRG